MGNAISTFILATSLHAALKHIDKAGLVKRLADDLDKCADSNLHGHSERFQANMVETLLLPLAKELLKENPDAYAHLLAQEQRQLVGGGQAISGELGNVPQQGQGTPTQNFVPKVR